MTDKEWRKFFNETIRGKPSMGEIIDDIIFFGGFGLILILIIIDIILKCK